LEKVAETQLYTHMHVREDEMSLWGFAESEERALFTLLISVSGIGVNTARVILSYMNPEEIKKAIVHEDERTLSSVKGIGPKTAKRIILDLKDKVMKSAGGEIVSGMPSGGNIIKDEALSALVALGFQKSAVEKIISQTLTKHKEADNVEDLIKMVLKQMT
jgi:Holliday junction DNA helicase RuvA